MEKTASVRDVGGEKIEEKARAPSFPLEREERNDGARRSGVNRRISP